MLNDDVAALITAQLTDAKVQVSGDGYHFQAVVVSDDFDGLNRVKRQQLVYQTLQDAIADGRLHAISIKALTADEWAQANNE